MNYYLMDFASVIMASALDVQSGHRVLDMCAAPGGKSLILAEKIGVNGCLVANEIQSSRRERLNRVMQQYLPPSVKKQVHIQAVDGTKTSFTPTFDRVLLDAPCSSDRHLIHDPSELAKWSTKRLLGMVDTQFKLILSAYRCLRKGGRLVYGTCALSPLENDDIIKRLLERHSPMVQVERLAEEPNILRRTTFGYSITPDSGQGWGPIYFSILTKTK